MTADIVADGNPEADNRVIAINQTPSTSVGFFFSSSNGLI